MIAIVLVGAGLANISGEKQTTSQQNPPSPMLLRINQMRRTSGVPVCQRNYYDRIIRNEESLQYICQYTINNFFSWELDL